MDVHKSFIVACVAVTNERSTTSKDSQPLPGICAGFASGEKNCAQNCLIMCNFKLDDMFSDVFSKSATRVLGALLEHSNENFELDGLISGKCKATPEQIHAALDGELNPMQAEKLSLIRQQIDNINALKAALEKLIFEIAAKYQPQIDLLMTIPGISTPLTAIRILAEIGAYMSVFETAKQLTTWAGLTPQNQESASKKKATRIGRAEAVSKASPCSNRAQLREIRQKPT